jgi:pyruvate-formate lyase-activating enzyme
MSAARVESANPLTGLVADTIPFSNVDGPGNRFVVFLQGCNFDCIACHNPQTIPGHAPIEGHHPRRMTVEDLLIEIRRAAPFLSGVTVSGGEATQQPAFLHALLSAVSTDPALTRLTTLIDSNGACSTSVWDLLAPAMDGAMIDLKCFDPAIHLEMTGQPNEQVLTSIRHLGDIDRLQEVRLLLIAGVNDDPGLLQCTGEWLAGVDPTMRVKVIGFREHGTRPHDPPLDEPTADTLQGAVELLAGIAAFELSWV